MRIDSGEHCWKALLRVDDNDPQWAKVVFQQWHVSLKTGKLYGIVLNQSRCELVDAEYLFFTTRKPKINEKGEVIGEHF